MEIVKKLETTKICELNSETILGSIRINSKNYTDAFISDPDGGPDIYIEGRASRNLALEGDVVRVKIRPQIDWKLNFNAIATRWDDWSKDLLPIIHQINKLEKVAVRDQADGSSANDAESLAEGLDPKRAPRSKRNAPDNNDVQKRTIPNMEIRHQNLPCNLPPEIAKLKSENLLKLPFYTQCVRKTGVVVEIVKQNHTRVAGGALKSYSKTQALFTPIDSRIPRMLIDIRECPMDFLSSPDRYKDVVFVAKLVCFDNTSSYGVGSLVKLVGDCNSIESRIEILLLEHQVQDIDFPPDVYNQLNYLECLPDNWFAENSKNRRDLTNECVFTIDPKTARDLDDAVSIKQLDNDIYEIGVHIADVSHFVEEMSAVDYHARLRTTSVYLVDRVIPMLPRPLCEHMCSLNSGETKLTFSVIWKMDKTGRIINEWFGKTVIKSCVKLAYENAQDLIDTNGDLSWIEEEVNMPKLHAFSWEQVSKSTILLNEIAKNMRAKRFSDGALKIDQVKLKFELDTKSGYPTGFTFEDRTDANYLIEEFMLQANMSVAQKIYAFKRDIAFLRRHPSSSPQVLKEVKEFCDAKGYPMDIVSAGSIQKSLNSISDPTISKVVSFLLLKAMKNAEYICTGALGTDESNFRHFALNVPFYTHFTSPIRRYADIIVHRQLSMALDYCNESNEDTRTLTLMALECTKRKISSKKISETSQKLYFNLFVQKSGFCELLACVTQIYDRSIDIILVDYSQTGRVYMDKIRSDLSSLKFESISGVKRLVLNWKADHKSELEEASKKKKKKKNKNKANFIESKARDEQATYRRCLGHIGASANKDLQVNEAQFGKVQVIQVFDVIRVIVTVDEKDISKLVIDLKKPE